MRPAVNDNSSTREIFTWIKFRLGNCCFNHNIQYRQLLYVVFGVLLGAEADVMAMYSIYSFHSVSTSKKYTYRGLELLDLGPCVPSYVFYIYTKI